MSTGEKIKIFNDLVESFLKQISPIIGTSYHHYFKQLVKVNAVMPIQNFIYYAIPLREKILNRDESYFNNPENHAEESNKLEHNPLNEIIRLQGIYQQLSTESKENVWDMTQALLIIAEEYLELKK